MRACVRVCMRACMYMHKCGGQRTTWRSGLSPFTVCRFQESNSGHQACTASTLTH